MSSPATTTGSPDLGEEICARIMQLAEFSESAENLTRCYLTPEHARANQCVERWMQAAGMSTRVDAAGNLIGRYEGRTAGAPALLLGSHLDTVRNAGRYDGSLGVLLPISCIAQLHAAEQRFEHAIEVIGFGDEEGVRFGSTLIGSKACAGTFSPVLLEATDAAGVTLAKALDDFGLGGRSVDTAAYSPQDVLGYVEVHIEQGPVLEAESLPVGIVTSIAGATRMQIHVAGMAGHAGTVPMALRQDALTAAAEMIALVEQRCSRPDLVGTVGQLEVAPGAVNVIPGDVRFSLDVRSGDEVIREQAVSELRTGFADIAARRGVSIGLEVTHDQVGCHCDDELMDALSAAVERCGVTPRRLSSGAGHDAMAMGDLTNVAMLFVRCTGGISHHPDEYMSAQDASVAANVLLAFLRDFKAERVGESP